MKTIIKIFIVNILTIYLSVSFITINLNPFEWAEKLRLESCLITLCTTFFSIYIYITYKITKGL
jgi:hypothetical protein